MSDRGSAVPIVTQIERMADEMKRVEHQSAQPCGCDMGANHICEWHTSHGLKLPIDPLTRQALRQANAPVPSPDTFVDVARPRTAQEIILTAPRTTLPTDKVVRKLTPIYSGVLKYFPKALAEVARVSYAGNEQHNPGQPLHWAREKSTDQHDCIVRHLLEAGTLDTDGMRHSAKVAWRALAALELELEMEGKC